MGYQLRPRLSACVIADQAIFLDIEHDRYFGLGGAAAQTGGRAARLDRKVLVERAVGRGLPRMAADGAVTLIVWIGVWEEKDGVLSVPRGNAYKPLPSEQRDQPGAVQTVYKWEERARTLPIVQDVIARRAEGRPAAAEPLDAFAEQLESLGYGKLRLWWTQMVHELRQLQPETAPVSVCVLAAALVEGSLTFVVRHARERDLAVFRRSEFDREPRSWKIDDLVGSAASGGDGAVLDAQARARADQLVRSRQRIHAGRMLMDYPAGPSIDATKAAFASGGMNQHFLVWGFIILASANRVRRQVNR